MPAAPVVRRPAQSPVLNTLPRRTGEREVRSSARLLEVYLSFFFFLNYACLFFRAQGFPPRPGLHWIQEKRASRLFRKMEVTVNNPAGVRRECS